jgi:hypothetical protein
MAFYGTRRFITVWQQPATCSYSEPDKFSLSSLSYFLKIHCNVTHPSTSMTCKRPLSLRLSNRNPICICLLARAFHMPRLSYSLWFDHLIMIILNVFLLGWLRNRTKQREIQGTGEACSYYAKSCRKGTDFRILFPTLMSITKYPKRWQFHSQNLITTQQILTYLNTEISCT